jgi:hemerythrin-like domain-containing protein
MGSIKDFMGNAHRACDELFAAAEETASKNDWERARDLFDRFQRATLHHFKMEEDVLFPAFETRTGMSMGPTQVMRGEHVQMRDLMQQMADAARSGDANAYLGHSETLNMLMQQHNMKEENVLYPMTDQALTGEQDDVLQAMQALPD